MLSIREAGQGEVRPTRHSFWPLLVVCFGSATVDDTSYSTGQESRKPCTPMAWRGAGSPLHSLVLITGILGQSLLAAAAPKVSLFVFCRFFILKHKSSQAAIWNCAPFNLPWVIENTAAGAVFPVQMFCLHLPRADLCQPTGTTLPALYMPC